MLRYLPFVLILALTIYALVDCVVNDDSDMPVELPKGVWVILIVLFPAIGPIAWLVVSRVGRRNARQARPGYGSGGGSPSGYVPPRRPARPQRMRPVAPDDDPEFLASLDRSAPSPEPAEPDAAAPPTPPADASEDSDDSEDDTDSDPRHGPTARS